MLPVAEAKQRLLAALQPLPSERVMLSDGLDRVLAADLVARRTQPPWDVSSMDGYAVRAADTAEPGRWLRVVGEARAGGDRLGAIAAGEAARIFTGAPLPAGADAVALQENAERQGDSVRFSRATRPSEFVRPRGLDFAAGWVGLRAGSVLDPRRLGLAATMGHVWLDVRRRPRIAILATGDELVAPGEPWREGGIVSSNSLVLAGLVRRWGGEPVDLGIAADRPKALAQALTGLGAVDLLVTSGGASVGDYDLVRSTLGSEGLAVDFWKIAMRPGKPLIFGRLAGQVAGDHGPVPLLGFPGNPVSATVCALVFLRAAMARMLGGDETLPLLEVPLASAMPANDEREDYVRARWVERDGRRSVEPASRQDSSMLGTLAHADALIVRPPHAEPAAAGTPVTVVPLQAAMRLAPA